MQFYSRRQLLAHPFSNFSARLWGVGDHCNR